MGRILKIFLYIRYIRYILHIHIHPFETFTSIFHTAISVSTLVHYSGLSGLSGRARPPFGKSRAWSHHYSSPSSSHKLSTLLRNSLNPHNAMCNSVEQPLHMGTRFLGHALPPDYWDGRLRPLCVLTHDARPQVTYVLKSEL